MYDHRILGGAVPVRPNRKIDEPIPIVEQFSIDWNTLQARIAIEAWFDRIPYRLDDDGVIVVKRLRP